MVVLKLLNQIKLLNIVPNDILDNTVHPRPFIQTKLPLGIPLADMGALHSALNLIIADFSRRVQGVLGVVCHPDDRGQVQQRSLCLLVLEITWQPRLLMMMVAVGLDDCLL